MNNSLIIGKFMPLHKGHLFLIDCARQFDRCKLHLVICSLKAEPISGKKRLDWMTQMYGSAPNIEIYLMTDEIPQTPEEHPDFWNIWKKSLTKVTGLSEYDFVFASETYGKKLAEIYNADFVPVDIDREVFPISATKIRENPVKNWDFMSLPVKQDFTKLFVIAGAESSGKTTLAKSLAKQYNSMYIPEYARQYLQYCRNNTMNFSDVDLVNFSTFQLHQMFVAYHQCNYPYIFSDTCPLTTIAYAKIYNKALDNDLFTNALHLRELNPHYIMVKPNMPWVADPLRDLEKSREEVYEDILHQVICHGFSYTEIDDPTWVLRDLKAIRTINELQNWNSI